MDNQVKCKTRIADHREIFIVKTTGINIMNASEIRFEEFLSQPKTNF